MFIDINFTCPKSRLKNNQFEQVNKFTNYKSYNGTKACDFHGYQSLHQIMSEYFNNFLITQNRYSEMSVFSFPDQPT